MVFLQLKDDAVLYRFDIQHGRQPVDEAIHIRDPPVSDGKHDSWFLSFFVKVIGSQRTRINKADVFADLFFLKYEAFFNKLPGFQKRNEISYFFVVQWKMFRDII